MTLPADIDATARTETDLFGPVLDYYLRQAPIPDFPADHCVAFADAHAGPDLHREWLRAALRTSHLRALVCIVSALSCQGRLEGHTPEARYDYFCDNFSLFAAEFDHHFPVLPRVRARLAERLAAAVLRFAAALASDRSGLTARFGIPASARVHAVRSGGDSHAGGQRVCVLEWTSGDRVVFKPRTVGGESAYATLTAALGRISPIRLDALQVWDRGDYGWVEYVDDAADSVRAEILRQPEFLRRCGWLCALLYALNAKDMHMDNLHITPFGPIPLDLETILHAPRYYADVTDASDVRRALEDSVQGLGFLPTIIESTNPENTGWMDIGFLGGGAGEGDPFRALIVERPFRDDMRLTFDTSVPPEFDEPAEVDRATAVRMGAAVAEGFDEAYRWIEAHRDEFWDLTRQVFAGVRLRYLHTMTQNYVHVLRLACSARAMAAATERRRLLERIALAGDGTVIPLVRSEMAQLADGDIPCFTIDAESDVICGPTGDPVASTTETPLQACRAKLDRMGADDLAEQTEMVWAAFVASHPEDHLDRTRLGTATPASGKDGLAAVATDLVDQLCRRARDDGRPTLAPSWIGPIPSTSRTRPWAPGVLGFDLYTGRTGVGLALAAASVPLQHTAARELATRIFDPCARALNRELEALADDLGNGTFSGVAGLPYALAEAGRWLDRSDWIHTAAVAARRLAQTPAAAGDQDTLDPLDIIEGLSGRLAAKGAAGAETEPGFRKLIDEVAARPATDETLLHSGFAHGVTGVLFQLAHSPLADEEISPAVNRLIDILATMRTPDDSDWITSLTGDGHTATGWCHGAAGIALGLGGLWLRRPALAPAEWVDTALQAMVNDGFGRNLSLCHGDLGNWEIAQWIHRQSGHPLAEAAVARAEEVLTADVIASRLQDRRHRNSLNSSLMVGTAGVALHLAQRLEPGLGISALMMHPTGFQP